MNILKIWKITEGDVILERVIDLPNEIINLIALSGNRIATFNHNTIDIWSTDENPYHDIIKLKRQSLLTRFHSFVNLFELSNGCLLGQMMNDNFYVYTRGGTAIRSEKEKLQIPKSKSKETEQEREERERKRALTEPWLYSF